MYIIYYKHVHIMSIAKFHIIYLFITGLRPMTIDDTNTRTHGGLLVSLDGT